MIISIIVAIGKNFEIGLNGKMPWHVPQDLKRFKSITMNHHLVMGRKTFESIGRPLPGRTTICLSHDLELHLAGVDMVHSLDDAITLAKKRGENELFIAGGAYVYKNALVYASKLYLTRVDYQGEADTFFPKINFAQWTLTSAEIGEGCSYEIWERAT